ncbi:mpv17 [Symbiodinium natans]|uniref:Mpv17 protein n=1 Tax=Symbiodinium natans TaxID=878477 RepID=A0A812NTD3_9DINO|nr:mpv17 [Symbiodinium natans]
MAFVALRYAELATRWPHLVSGMTSSAILTSADMFCQGIIQQPGPEGLDYRRTAGLASFGLLWYGGPCKWLYLCMDRWLGAKATFQNVAAKTFVDVFLHTPFGVVPGFYFVTGAFKGDSLAQTREQLKSEWMQASMGSSMFWTPAQIGNFWLVPQHYKIAYISVLSFFHKTWLSFLSNKERYAATLPATPLSSLAVAADGLTL